MNSCEYYQELISRLVDGEISREEHEALMAHMNTCSRCNAMYAVFHDLSDILSEEPGELPEGLHENIMAGVRRSEMMKKNRRLRSFGLRTALTAAACALLVLFAASGFGPGKRTGDVSLRTQEAAEQLYQAPAENTPAPTEEVFVLPAQTPAPAPVWTQTPAPAAAPDAYLTTGNSVNETQYTLQPEQNIPYEYAAPAPAAVQTPEPFVVQTPEPVVMRTPEPVVVQTPEPAVVQMPEPASAPASEEIHAPASAETRAAAQSESAMPAPSEEAVPAAEETDTAAAEEQEDTIMFSLFSGMRAKFGSAEPDEAAEDGPDYADANADALSQESADSGAVMKLPTPVQDGDAEMAAPAEKPEKKPAEETVRLYGREARGKLMALLGGSKSELPAEAELTRVIHVVLCPEDAYGSEEKLDVNIYGDFVYYRLFPAEGEAGSFRADCALRELNSLLKDLAAQGMPSPKPSPTTDPYVGEEPAA